MNVAAEDCFGCKHKQQCWWNSIHILWQYIYWLGLADANLNLYFKEEERKERVLELLDSRTALIHNSFPALLGLVTGCSQLQHSLWGFTRVYALAQHYFWSHCNCTETCIIQVFGSFRTIKKKKNASTTNLTDQYKLLQSNNYRHNPYTPSGRDGLSVRLSVECSLMVETAQNLH